MLLIEQGSAGANMIVENGVEIETEANLRYLFGAFSARLHIR